MDIKRNKILIVEDEAVIAMELEERLGRMGYEITGVCASGDAAFQSIKAQRPDIVLMDICIQGDKDGVEVAGEIGARFNIPVVYVTAHSDEATLQRAKATGPFGYLLKPFRELDLHAAIEMALYKHVMEQTLRDSEERYRALAESARDFIYIVDKDGIIRYVNAYAAERLQRTPQDLIGKSLEEFLPPDLAALRLNNIRSVLDSKEPLHVEELSAIAGEEVWLSTTLVPLMDTRGTAVSVFGIARDITELRRAYANFREILEFAPEAMVVIDRAGRIRLVNAQAERIFAYSRHELLDKPMDILLPERYRAGHGHLQERFFQESASRLMQGRGELVGRRRDGSEFPIEVGLSTLKAVDGLLAMSVIRDVTARKLAEEALREQAQILDQIHDSVIVTDLDGVITRWNRGSERLYGYSAEEAIGRRISFLYPENEQEFLSQQVILPLMSQGFHEIEVPTCRKSGETLWVHLSLAMLRGGDGAVYGMVAYAIDITEQKTQASELEHQSLHDALTGLPNRILMQDRLRQAIHAADRDNKPLALLVMDLNHFKDINDALGHQYGDLLLQQVGPRVLSVLRECETISRLGGDEFAVLLPSTDSDGATAAATKIVEILEQPFAVGEFALDTGVSIGIALFPEHGNDVETLLRRADVAMYQAKQSGNGVAVYVSERDRHSPRRLALMGEMRHAIQRGEMVLHYQPKIDLNGGRIIGVEALVRWQHPKYGLIPPDQFITLAEQTGGIKPLTLWVLGEAVRQCRVWNEAGIDLTVAVNLSTRNLQDTHLPDQIDRVLSSSGMTPDKLEMEITESAIMADPERALEVLTQLRAMNILIAIDDFGTGYSSLGYLKRLPVGAVKVDKSFVLGMAANENDAAIVRSTVDLAHNLGLKVVAEGVENRESWEGLAAMGCDAAQGYYMCRPLPAAELTRWIRESRWGL